MLIPEKTGFDCADVRDVCGNRSTVELVELVAVPR